MKWPTIDHISAMLPLPGGYRYETLARPGIPALIEGIRQWHPDIAVGGGSCYLREDFYTSNVFLDGEAEKQVYVGVFKRGDELAGMWSFEQEPDALTLYGRLIVIAPAHRATRLASTVMPLAELVGRAMGGRVSVRAGHAQDPPRAARTGTRGISAHRLHLGLRPRGGRAGCRQARVRRGVCQGARAGG